MPALVKSRFGASGKSGDDGTTVCFFSRKKSKKDFLISAEVMTFQPPMDTNKHEWGNVKRTALTHLPIAHRYKAVGCHLIHVELGSERLAERGRFVKERAFLFQVEPFHKHENMAVRLVHNVGRLKIVRRGKTATDFGKGRGRIALRRLPTSTDEAGTIDTDCLSARGSVIEPAFLRSVNIARRFSGV